MNNTPTKHRYLIHIVVLFVTLIWSFNNIAFKIAFIYMSAPLFNLLRLLIAFPLMVYLAFFSSNRVPFEKRDLFFLILIGIGGYGVFQLLFPIGLDNTSPAIGGILMATMPIHVVILSIVFKLEKITLPIIIGVLFTLVGLTLIALFSSSKEGMLETSLTGIILVVVAEFGFALNTTFLKPYLKKYPTLQLTSFVMGVSVLFYTLVNTKNVINFDFSLISFKIILLAVYSGIIALFGANILWNRAIDILGSAKTSVYANVPPVFVLILSMIIFKDFPHPIALLGSAIILMGVYVVNKRDKRVITQLPPL